MQLKDLKAHIEILNSLLVNLRDCSKIEKISSFSNIKTIINLLDDESSDLNGSGNVLCILNEIELHVKAIAGLYPSYELSENEHYQLAKNSISKLGSGPAANTLVGNYI